MCKNHNLSKALAADILSSFINNDNKNIIKIIKKLIIIYEKILHRKKLTYFLKYYYNVIKCIYNDNSNHYGRFNNNSIIVPTSCYMVDNKKQYINSYTQIYPDKYSVSSFSKDINYSSNNNNNYQNIPKSKTNYISLQKKIMNTKIITKNKQNINYQNPFKKYNSLNSSKSKIKSNSKSKNQTSQQSITSNYSKNHQTTKITTDSSNNNNLIDDQSNKRTLSYGNLGKTMKKMEYKLYPLNYGNYNNIDKKYILKTSLPPNSQSIREFFPKQKLTNCNYCGNYQLIPAQNFLNSDNDDINDSYCISEKLKINDIPNNFKKLKTNNLINNINVLLKNEVPIINNNDIYSNNNDQYKNTITSPTCINKPFDLYYIQTENELYNNEENQINEQILAYINSNNEVKQELIDRINNDKKSISTKTLYINQNSISNENNSLYINDTKDFCRSNFIINSENNYSNYVQYSNNKRINTDYKKHKNSQNDSSKQNNKDNNNIIYRNKNLLDKQNKKTDEKILNTFTKNTENIPIGPVNILPQNKKTSNKCTKTKLKIKNLENNLNENNCLNLTINANQINNTKNKSNKKQTNIISNEINVEFHLRNEENLLKDNELNDNTVGLTMQSLNDSKMLEMASKYVYEDNAKIDKNLVNEILNEKNSQKLLKQYK